MVRYTPEKTTNISLVTLVSLWNQYNKLIHDIHGKMVFLIIKAPVTDYGY